tara:strand:- start:951 stop:1232 length:282 start_codon:yes stop_codon:yes gene_type:complete
MQLTRAEKITGPFGDGQTFEVNGLSLEESLRDACDAIFHVGPDIKFFFLPDDSIVSINAQHWDVCELRFGQLFNSNGDVVARFVDGELVEVRS